MHLARAYELAKSEEQFYQLLKDAGLNLYFRGKQPGIQGNKRKYRLSTLGFSLERIQLLSLSQNRRTQELDRIVSRRRSDRQRDNEQEQ